MGIKKSHLLCLASKIVNFVLKAANIILIWEASKEFYAEEWHDLIYILKGSL